MKEVNASVEIRCDCNCAKFVVEKTVWEDESIAYNITTQDSRYNHNHNTALGRLKSAFKILFGKGVYYNDVYIDDPEKFKGFVSRLVELCEDAKT